MKRGFTTSKLVIPMVLLMVGWLVHPFGKLVDFFFFLASFITLVAGMSCMQKQWLVQAKIKEEERAKQVFAELRHDWMNHIQVLMGYLMMKKEEPIRKYLNKLVQQAQTERTVSRLMHAPLAVALLELPHRQKEWEVTLAVSEAFGFGNMDEEKIFLEIWQRLLAAIEKKQQLVDEFVQASFSLKSDINGVQVNLKFTGSDPTEFLSDDFRDLLEKQLRAVEPSIAVTLEDNGLQLTYNRGSD
ncbi:Spo0B domain-containing protein [Thermoactinomyces mirandus]|uniref:Spo0B domain-containing protein n=1 Tax=Thermoactinomyces mirandus TaxID=2756294 RepID=A0A7W1XT05_9BACL|nr:Spo0B domain-containing protein [Thermoactinomyces mirandus]MBA4602727.1 Spo0B domain-containing protein [Thermoactinomyces mirandus]